ncbi:hypothetical protein EDB85DRAFT_1817018, partial [Lactarius pseudohatsudake]
IQLNCLVLSDHHSSIFELQIAATESTTILKHLIKEKRQPVFDHIPADAIALWKVSVPINDSLMEILDKINFAEKPPITTMELLLTFGTLTQGYLHLIVK